MIKEMKTGASALLFVMMAAFTAGCGTTQQASLTSPDSAFTFEAQTVNPVGGSSRQITGDYILRFSRSRVQVDLPYFGRSYSAPVNPTEGGIKLNTTAFGYEVKKKRRGWEMVIRPDEQRNVQVMVLSVSENGYGTLQVTSTNRQSISYYGRVRQNDLVNN
jgi:hypothetical protein